MLSNLMPEPGSPDDVDRIWDMTCRGGGAPPPAPHRVQFSLVCPSRATADYLAQYLARSAEFTCSPVRPGVSGGGAEYWGLEVVSPEGPLSLSFLRDACATVR